MAASQYNGRKPAQQFTSNDPIAKPLPVLRTFPPQFFPGMPVFTDQLGRTIVLPRIPRRIISLVPSQTELLYSLGLEGSVVGITRFCVHPNSWFREKSRIGGTKAIDPARVDAL